MDRRDFLRRLLISSAMGVAGVGGILAIVEKLAPLSSTPLPAAPSIAVPSVQGTTIETSTVTEMVTSAETTTVTAPASSATDPASSVSSSAATETTSQSSTSDSSSSTSTSTQNTLSGYIYLAPVSAVSGKSYAYFNHPTYGSSILINYSGTWKAFSAVCTHAGCTVDFTSTSLFCPCHSGNFSPVNGSPTSGPVSVPLAEFDIKIVNNGLYVSSNRIN